MEQLESYCSSGKAAVCYGWKADIRWLAKFARYCGGMTSIVTAFGFVVALLSTSAEAADKTRPRWMIGQWAWVDPKEALDRGDCPESKFYGRNGYVTTGESVSRWWIEGDYLVRVTLDPGYGEPMSEAGRVYRQRFTRTRRDKLVFRGDGYVQWLIRCGDVPPEWEYQPKR
jgi:hypothetical protein